MRPLLPVAAVLLIAVSFAAGRQGGQDSNAKAGTLLSTLDETQKRGFVNGQIKPTDFSNEPLPNLGLSYDSVAADPLATSKFVDGTVGRYYAAKGLEAGVVQQAQVAADASVRLQSLIVAQNARIIILLGKIASKPAGK